MPSISRRDYADFRRLQQVNAEPRAIYPTVPQPGLVLIKPQFSSGTALEHEMVTWWQGPGGSGLTVAQLQFIQTTFDTWMEQVWEQFGATASFYNSSYLQDYSSTSGLSVAAVTGTHVAGTQGAQWSDNVAVLVSWKTTERWKGGHGRWYLPALGASTVAAPNNVNSAQITQITNQITSLLSHMTGIAGTYGGPYNFVIYRHRTGKTGTPHTLVPTGFVVQPELATQRRRLRKAAHH